MAENSPIGGTAPSGEPGAPASPANGTTRLRAEAESVVDAARKARLLGELGALEERASDEPAAARDYLAAFNADPTFREPLEGLVRLLERRGSLKNLGRVIDALADAAGTPQETARALLMRAAFLEDVQKDVQGAIGAAREAAALDLSGPEALEAWLALELLAARADDKALREEALGARAQRTGHETWQGLLRIDLARIAADDGDVDLALERLTAARELGGGATFAAALAAERLTRAEPGDAGSDEATRRTEATAAAAEAQATMLYEALANPERGDALGVPRWMRRPAHAIDAWLRAADAHRVLGDLTRAAALLDRALGAMKPPASVVSDPDQAPAAAEGAPDADDPIVTAAVLTARLRVAELMGETQLAAELAERRLATEKDAGLAASLAMRVAERAASQNDRAKALEALSRAVVHDPGCSPARALQLDMLADGPDAAVHAAQLEALADVLESDEAKGRAFLLAAYVWALRADDGDAAKGALSQAGVCGVAPATLARLGRALASARADAASYDEATRRLIASGASPEEVAPLWFELVRLRLGRGDAESARKALGELAAAPGGAWLGRALQAFLPDAAETRSGALEQLAALETDVAMARGLGLVAALAAPDPERRQRLRALGESEPGNVLLAAVTSECDRLAGDGAAAGVVADRAARAAADATLATSLHLEAGLSRWQTGDKANAMESFERAAEAGGEGAREVLAWASRAMGDASTEGRRIAIGRALDCGADPHVLGLERFALEAARGDAGDAAEALGTLEGSANGDCAMAAAIARLVWPEGSTDASATSTALGRIAAAGASGAAFAAAEKLRLSRDDDLEEATEAAQAWFDTGGGVAAALEWLACAHRAGRPDRETAAMRGLADAAGGTAGETLRAGAALRLLASTQEPQPLVAGESTAVRLANLELAAPGCDPRKRMTALSNVGDTLGDDGALDALGLAGWSMLACGELDAAKAAFQAVTAAHPSDLAGWEGLRSTGEATQDLGLVATAASELGTRCADPRRGAAFWEEAANTALSMGDPESAERAFEEAFTRDPERATAFDKLFRSVRARKDNSRLLDLINRRLPHANDPTDIVKLYWEQARALRESGDPDGALEALEQVTMVEPEHVGALALSGEIFIRRGAYAQAVEKLDALARLDAAPAKNRLTAGVAAVDLYEKKLDAPEKAVEVLLVLHRAGLSTLPVRERLAKAAARTGKSAEAVEILEQLMNERESQEGRVEAARLALALRRDRLGDIQGATSAVQKLLGERPGDAEGLDTLLQIEAPDRPAMLERGRQALLAVAADSVDAPAALRLSRISHALGDPSLEQAAGTVAVALGAREAEQDIARLAARKPRVAQMRLSGALFDKLAAPGDDGPIAAVFAMLGPTLREALGPSLEGLGVGRRDRVDPRAGLALRNELAAWAGAFGIDEFELYVGGHDPQGVQGVPGQPHALVVGPEVNAPFSPALRARIVRELFALVRGTTVLRFRDETSVAAIVVAACHLAGVSIQAPAYAVLAEIEKLLKSAIARKVKNALAGPCTALVQSGVDAASWSRAALMSHARAALVGSGDLTATLEAAGLVATDARASALARFALAPEYLELRRGLGLEVTS